MLRAVIFDMYETLITHYRCPLYFGTEMAAEAGISPERFLPLWRATNDLRSTGQMTLEAVLTDILLACDRYSDTLLETMVTKRIRTKETCFANLHEGILPMLDGLKARGLRIGLVSNCFSEEAAVIERSCLYPYFDSVCLSWREGVQKPDPEIFRRCMTRLGVGAGECLYIGDGGSHELEAARALDMHTAQAVWYLCPASDAERPKSGFIVLDDPLQTVRLAETLMA